MKMEESTKGQLTDEIVSDLEHTPIWRRCVSLDVKSEESNNIQKSNVDNCGLQHGEEKSLENIQNESKQLPLVASYHNNDIKFHSSERLNPIEERNKLKKGDSSNTVIDIFTISEEEMVTEQWLEDELNINVTDKGNDALIANEAEKELLVSYNKKGDDFNLPKRDSESETIESKKKESIKEKKDEENIECTEKFSLFGIVPGLSYVIAIKDYDTSEINNIGYHCVLCNKENSSVSLTAADMINHVETRRHIMNVMSVEIPSLYCHYKNRKDTSTRILLQEILEYESTQEPQKLIPALKKTFYHHRAKVIEGLMKIQTVDEEEDMQEKCDKKSQITFDESEHIKNKPAEVATEHSQSNQSPVANISMDRKHDSKSTNERWRKQATSHFNMSEFLCPYQIKILNDYLKLTSTSNDGKIDDSSSENKDRKMKYPLRELRPVHNIYQSSVRDIKTMQINRSQNNIVIVTDGRDDFDRSFSDFNDKVKILKIPNLDFSNAFESIQMHPNFGKGTVFAFSCGTFNLLPPVPLQDCVLAECPNPQTMLTLPQRVDDVHNTIRNALDLHINILQSTVNDIALFCGLLPVQVGKYNRFMETRRACIQQHSAIQKPKTSQFSLNNYKEALKYYNMFAIYHAQTLGYAPWDLEVPCFSLLKAEKSLFQSNGFHICSDADVIRTNQVKLLCGDLLKLPSFSGVNVTSSENKNNEQGNVSTNEKYKYDQIAIITDVRYLPFLSHLKRPGVTIFANNKLDVEDLRKYVPKEDGYLAHSTLILLVLGIHSVTNTVSAGVCRSKHCKERDPLQALIPVNNFDEYVTEFCKTLQTSLKDAKSSLPSHSSIAVLPSLPITVLRHVNSIQHSTLHMRQAQHPLCKIADKMDNIVKIYPTWMERTYKISCSSLSEYAGQHLSILSKLDGDNYKTLKIISHKKDIDDQILQAYDSWKDVASVIISSFKNSSYFPPIQTKLPAKNLSVAIDLRNNVTANQNEKSCPSPNYGAGLFDFPPMQNLLVNDLRTVAALNSRLDRTLINYQLQFGPANVKNNSDINRDINLGNKFDRPPINFPINVALRQGTGEKTSSFPDITSVGLSHAGLNASIADRGKNNGSLMNPFDVKTKTYHSPFEQFAPACNYISQVHRETANTNCATFDRRAPQLDQVAPCSSYGGSFVNKSMATTYVTQLNEMTQATLSNSDARISGTHARNVNKFSDLQSKTEMFDYSMSSNTNQDITSCENINRDLDEIIKFSRTLLNSSKKVKKPNKGPNSSFYDNVFIVGTRDLITPLIECNIKSTMISYNFNKFNDHEVKDLLAKMGDYQQNSVCCFVFNVSVISRKLVLSSGCLKHSCQQPIYVNALQLESLNNANIFEELDRLIISQLKCITKFIRNLSKHIPVLILPLVPTRIFCEEENSSYHQISHTLNDLGFCSVYGSRALWNRAVHTLVHSWSRLMELINTNCDSCKLVSGYVDSNPKTFITLNNINDFITYWMEPDVWKAFAETLLMTLVPMKLKGKSNIESTHSEKVSVTVSQISPSIPSKFFEELFLAAERNVLIELGKDCFTLKNMSLCRANLLVKKLNHYHVGDTVLLASVDGQPCYDDGELNLLQKLFILSGIEKVYQTWKSQIISILIGKINEVRNVATLKMSPCSEGYDCRGPSLCFNYHGPQDMRRNPFLYVYSDVMCSMVRREDGLCKDGVDCPFSHTIFEAKFHPLKYQVRLCPSDNFSEICNSQDSLCNYAHKDSPELFYTPEWVNIIIVGPHHALNYFTGAIRAVAKVKNYQHRLKVILISPSSEFLDVAVKASDELLRTFGLKVCELDKNLNNVNSCQVLVGNPNSFVSLSNMEFRNLTGAIIVDDIQNIMRDDRHVDDMQNFFVKNVNFANFILNKVFVSASFDARIDSDLSRIVNTQFKQLNTHDQIAYRNLLQGHCGKSESGDFSKNNRQENCKSKFSKNKITSFHKQYTSTMPNQYHSSQQSDYQTDTTNEYQPTFVKECNDAISKEYVPTRRSECNAADPNAYSSIGHKEYPDMQYTEYSTISSNEYSATTSDKYVDLRSNAYQPTRYVEYSATMPKKYFVKKSSDYETTKQSKYPIAKPHEYPSDKPNEYSSIKPNEYPSVRSNDNPFSKSNLYQMTDATQYQGAASQIQCSTSSSYQSMGSDQCHSTSHNHYSSSTNQYQSSSSNHYQSSPFNQYQSLTSNQYQSSSPNKYQSTSPNKYQSTIPSPYQSTTLNQYQSTASNQYQSTTPSQYQSTASTQFQTNKEHDMQADYREVRYPDVNYPLQKRSRSKSPLPSYPKRSRDDQHSSSLTLSHSQEDLQKRFGKKLYEEYTAALDKMQQKFDSEFKIYYDNPEMYPNSKVHYVTFVNMYDLKLKNISPQHRDGLWKLFWRSKIEEIRKEECEIIQKNLIKEFDRKISFCSSTLPTTNAVVPPERGNYYSFSEALALIDRVCNDIGFLGLSVKALIKSCKFLGSNSKETYSMFAEPENIMLINIVAEKLRSLCQSATDETLYLYETAIDWIPKFLEDSRKGPVTSMERKIDIEAIGKAAVGKGSKFALDLIKTALIYEGIQDPQKDLINDLFLKVCNVQYNLKGNT